ncbi:MAG: hypothetical protein ABIG28_00840 [archaeon]
MRKNRLWGFSDAGIVVFFLDVFLALLIISGSWLLVKTPFGRASLTFGFVMLVVTTILKFSRNW